MPGFTTHYLLGTKAYNDLPSNQLKFIISKYRWLYQIGLQGPDMFFYNIPILRHRDYRNVGSYMHEYHVNDFFAACLRHLSNIKSRQQREQGIAFVAGFFCHYIGDYICHPYVYGRIQYDPKNPTAHAHGLHALLENDLDALLLLRYKKKKPSQFNQAATIGLNPQESQFISRFLAECINRTYYPISPKNNFQVTPRMVQRSIMAMRFGCRTLWDPNGSKKNKIALVESLLFQHHHAASKKLITDEVENPRESLNSDHQPWTNPWNRALASTDSFPQLFKRCLEKCSIVYFYFNACIHTDGLDDERYPVLLDELGNYSYHSGLLIAD